MYTKNNIIAIYYTIRKDSNNMRKKTSLLVIGLIISSCLIGLFPIIAEKVNAYTPHETIHINGNTDFVTQVVSEGWSGNGTKGNPYIIEGYDINPNLYGIEIRSTTVNFIIRDSRVINGIVNNHCGIYLNNVTNGTIYNCIIENNQIGIILSSSNHNLIFNNNILSNNHNGILFFNSSENIINNNNVLSNGLGGIYVTESKQNDINGNNISYNEKDITIELSSGINIVNNTIIRNNISLGSCKEINITNNLIIKSGIIINGDYLEHWNTHNIDNTNTVNGRPVYYWKNRKRGIVPVDAGQVILANCSDVTIENQELNNSPFGIILGFSSNNNITSNTVSSNSKYGIYLYSSSGNTIIGNSVTDSGWNIHLYYSNDNTIKDNTMSNTIFSLKYMGIHLEHSNKNNITDNTAINNGYGIYLFSSSDNNITNNNVSKNDDGIHLNSYCYWNNFTGNTIYQNNDNGIHIYGSDNNIFHHNNIINNTNQLFEYKKKNIWDDGNGKGNYWSDYNGSDEDDDGVGDTNLPHLEVDHYPLILQADIIYDGDNDTIEDKGSIFSEIWFQGLIILLVIIILIIIALMMRKKSQ
jgi:parallel beta-helix repeat protein